MKTHNQTDLNTHRRGVKDPYFAAVRDRQRQAKLKAWDIIRQQDKERSK